MFGTFEWNFEFENWFTKMLSCNWINGYVIDVLLVKWLKNDKMDLKYGNQISFMWRLVWWSDQEMDLVSWSKWWSDLEMDQAP